MLAAFLALTLSVGPLGTVPQGSNADLESVGAQGSAQHAETFHRMFLQAFNSGERQSIRRFLQAHFRPDFLETYAGGLDGSANRYLDLYRLYGPSDQHSVQRGMGEAILWSRGRITHGWLGFQWRFDASGSVTRQTLWRLKPPTAEGSPALEGDELRSKLESYLSLSARHGHFSGAVLLARNGEVVYSGAFGDAELSRRKNDLDTRFNIGSVAKMLTGVAALRLIEIGKMRLEDPVSQFVPEYPRPAGDLVTIRHLLTHTSGIRFNEVEGFREEAARTPLVRDLVMLQIKHARRVGLDAADFKPSDQFTYSNEGIELLGLCLERAAGTSWDQVVQTHVLQPAGMTRTSFAREGRGPLAIGYTPFAGDTDTYGALLVNSDPLLRRRASPAGQVYSTVGDLHAFLRGLLEERLLSRSSVAAMFAPQAEAGSLEPFRLQTSYGYTTQISSQYGVTTKGHGGVVPGYSAQLLWFPVKGYELVVLCNRGDTAAHIVVEYVTELVSAS